MSRLGRCLLSVYELLGLTHEWVVSAVEEQGQEVGEAFFGVGSPETGAAVGCERPVGGHRR